MGKGLRQRREMMATSMRAGGKENMLWKIGEFFDRECLCRCGTQCHALRVLRSYH